MKSWKAYPVFLKFKNDVYMHKNKNRILKIPNPNRGYSSPCIRAISKSGFAVSPEAGALCLSSGPCSSAHIRLGCSRAGRYRRCRRKEPLPPQPRAARKHSNLELSTESGTGPPSPALLLLQPVPPLLVLLVWSCPHWIKKMTIDRFIFYKFSKKGQ